MFKYVGIMSTLWHFQHAKHDYLEDSVKFSYIIIDMYYSSLWRFQASGLGGYW